MRFLAGFLSSSLLWGGFVFAYSRGLIDISLEPEAPQLDAQSEAAAETEGPSDPKRPRKRAAKGQKRIARSSGESQSGDDLGEDDPRTLDARSQGGEQQLRQTEIERGFDDAFGQIRRCLVLAASDEPVQGKVVFGLRISGRGTVAAVNLRGPSSVTQGECGACLRKAASSMRFRSFDGPDMIVHYPITLE